MPEKIISHPGNDNWYDNYDKVFGVVQSPTKAKSTSNRSFYRMDNEQDTALAHK